MEIIFSPKAFHQLSKLERSVQRRITDKLIFFSLSKNTFSFAERLVDTRFGKWRFRIGEYRVLFDAEDDVLVILKIGHRKDIYR